MSNLDTMAQRLLSTFAISFVITAQPATGPDPTKIAAMLRSPDAREQAWGAWYASRDRMRELLPDLQQMAAQRLDGISPAEVAARDIALDALIQMEAGTAPELLADIYRVSPDHALILASQTTDSSPDEFLLHVLRESENERWFATANLLLSRKSAGLVSGILSSFKLEAPIFLVEREGIAGGHGSGMEIGCGWTTGGTDLPPWPTYRLTTFPRSGVSVLATGPVPIYFERRVAPAGQGRDGGMSTVFGPSAAERVKYLATLANLDERELPLRGDESYSIVWRETTNLDAELERIRGTITERFGRLLQVLVSAGVLTSEEAERQSPQIEFEVRDMRGSG